MVDREEFLEWAEYQGQLYGTARSFVEGSLEAGRDVILDIDVQGARQVKKKMPDAVSIFILPPSFAELERRLRDRRLESDDSIRRRLEIARGEIVFYRDYDYIIVNDVLEKSILLLEGIVRGGGAVPPRQEDCIDDIISSFGGSG